MPEDKQVQNSTAKDKIDKVEAKKSFQGQRRKGGRSFKSRTKNPDDMDQRILEIARVTRVMAGGKRMNFRACVAVGNKKKHQIGVGVGKGSDVTIAINKGVNKAKKALITVPITNDTIPHEVREKFGAARLVFKPARKGKGVIAGGVARVILELAGIKNITSKLLGSNNKINNARCTIKALASLQAINIEKKEDRKEVEINKDKK